MEKEKRLIDPKDFLDLFYVASAGQDKAFVKAVEMVVEDTPTVDAVEVVRCKDCKYRNNEMFCPMLFVETTALDDGGGNMVDDYIERDNTTDDSFCSYGERNDNTK